MRLYSAAWYWPRLSAGPELAIASAVALRRLDEHAVVLALDLRQRIAERAEEIGVGGDDRAVHVELDHGLRLVDRRDLASEIGVLQLLRGDVGREFGDAERLAVLVEQRVVGGEDPDLAAALADALVFAGLVFAAVQPGPELAIGRAVALSLRHEQAVMLALDFGQRIAERLAEILVRSDDGAVELELDHGLGAADGGDLASFRHAADLLRGDIGRDLDDLDRLAVAVKHRIIGRLDPDLAAALRDPLELARPDTRRGSMRPRTPCTRRCRADRRATNME